MNRLLRLVFFSSVLSLFSLFAFAQANVDESQGLKPYDSLHGGDLDSVSLTNGALTLHIPFLSYPQRDNLELNFALTASSKQWTVITTCVPNGQGGQTCTFKWGALPRGGRMPISQYVVLPPQGALIMSSTDWWLQSSFDSSGPNYARSIVDPDGAIHSFGTSFGGPITFPMRSLDATGLLHLDSNTVVLPNGTRYIYSTIGNTNNGLAPSAVIDPNGNEITISGSQWTDSLGRLIPPVGATSDSDLSGCPSGTASARDWDVPGYTPVSSTRRFKLCYSPFTISTNFGTGPQEYGPTSVTMLSAVIRPDGTSWTLSYDNYGDVSRIGLPTGGSISYTYARGPISCGGGSVGSASMWVTSRTVDANDGTGGHTWNYAYSGAVTTTQVGGVNQSNYSGTATVTSPDGNDTVHTITNPVAGAYCSLYDTQTKYYQGSAGSGTLVKTSTNQYTGTVDSLGGNGTTADNIVLAQTTETRRDGNTSKAVNTWDSGSFSTLGVPVVAGSLLQKDEYDFSNSLVRSTVNHYLWQDNSTYKTNNFLDRKVSSKLQDGGGCEMAKTSYGYDETYNSISLQPSGVATQFTSAPASVRGNHTSTSQWLISACAEQSAITSHAIPYDTGMSYQSFDPLGRVTQNTYSSTFAGAYLTQTNLPDTQMPDTGAPIVHHIISGNYDFNTGLLTSFTDENSQQYTYSYDNMLRLTQGNHPDGGITKFLYPDPNTVERQRLISGTTYDDFKVKFDGLGRPYQTQQPTPDCGSSVKVDTTYDVVGRIKTVSNSYCLTTESTYGITQTNYDALSRVIKTTKQDSSFTTLQYEDTPGDTSGAPLTCTTTTDESGKKRQNCSDAFGRLAKVIEPNPGATATTAAGSVTINGAEQSGTAAPGTGTVTINGAEQTVCQIQTCPPHVTTGDTGTVSITVNGVQKSISYTKSSNNTTTLIASALASAFHNDGTAPVDATSSGSVVTLTARASGVSTNYSLSAASTYNTSLFSQPSFTTQPSGSTLTGGHDAAVDSGSVTVTINGTNYSTTFGSGDTATSIAGRLTPAINAGSWVSASATGATINFTSKVSGSAGNYSLSGSYTWNTGIFTNPSFTTSTSGATLGGGKDATGLNNNPFVTTYQYNIRNNMLCVHQKATDTTADVACTGTAAPSVPAAWRQRFFTYDSLSRLLTAMNPEMNSTGSTVISYSYDNNGNMISKTEPAPNQAWGSAATVTSTHTYDTLNRPLDITYSDGTTPASYHRYDYNSMWGVTLQNPIGRETVSTSANTGFLTSYDSMGRVIGTTQCNPNVTGCKYFTAAYDKLGDLTSLMYPGNSFSVTYGYDNAGRLISATDSAGVIYAQNPAFTAGTMIKEFTSPNFNNNKYHVDYNSRLQPVEIWAGSAQGASALFDKQYSYGTAGSNNGNIFNITNLKDSTRTQSFTYDPLNRLLTAGDNGHWANSYVFDAWGNLYQKNPGSPAGENMVKVADTNNHLSGLTYDAAGNVINDGQGGSFVFDGENRITTAGSTSYTYDAFGRRVQKSSGINYWYGPSGVAYAETDSAGNWTNYIFFGGRRLARNVPQPSPNPPSIQYYITDHLNSTGMFVDKAGTSAAILDDNDFYPWGGSIPGVGKSTSNNTIKFTGQYRDTDTVANLDYFGARYYSNTLGRFMSPDWAAKPVTVPYAKFGDPQSLNLYSYVENGPVNRVDADGHCEVLCAIIVSGAVETILWGAGKFYFDAKNQESIDKGLKAERELYEKVLNDPNNPAYAKIDINFLARDIAALHGKNAENGAKMAQDLIMIHDGTKIKAKGSGSSTEKVVGAGIKGGTKAAKEATGAEEDEQPQTDQQQTPPPPPPPPPQPPQPQQTNNNQNNTSNNSNADSGYSVYPDIGSQTGLIRCRGKNCH